MTAVVRLSALRDRLPASAVVIGDLDRSVTAIAINSRAVTPGALFVAVPGEHTDGHRFVTQAIKNGAVAVVVEAARALDIEAGTTAIHVPDARRALASLAAAFFGDPSHALDVIGVTGTNGKTTTTHMIASILDTARRTCGVIGTVGAFFNDRAWRLSNTTPLPPELHGLLAQMRDEGGKCVAMEVSSHALVLDRVEDVRFAVAALTNVTRDHLDFHTTIDAYASAKHRLFEMAAACVLNLDDEWGARWSHTLRPRKPVITYAIDTKADLVARGLVLEAAGSRFSVDATEFNVRIPGRFNVLNALAAIGVARALGVDDAVSARGLAALERVPGRMERIGDGEIAVVVDYAHTPDSLDQALRALRETTRRELIVVFGCGGDRDRGKRQEMGAAAARHADRIYVTSDNPRSEDARAIVEDILPGLRGHEVTVELDRHAAIEGAIAQAQPGDTVLIAGKGHETYQIIGDRVAEFDDAAEARAALARRSVAS